MRRLLVVGALVTALGGAAAALASTGMPPAGMSPIAGSLYKAQFALCSLQTIDGIANRERVGVGTLTPVAAALTVARAHERDLGAAAVQGCRAGLLYRYRNDKTVAGLRSDLSQRITAEKYVAGVYGLIAIAFFAYVMIHAAKVSRLGHEVADLVERLDTADPTRPVTRLPG